MLLVVLVRRRRRCCNCFPSQIISALYWLFCGTSLPPSSFTRPKKTNGWICQKWKFGIRYSFSNLMIFRFKSTLLDTQNPPSKIASLEQRKNFNHNTLHKTNSSSLKHGGNGRRSFPFEDLAYFRGWSVGLMKGSRISQKKQHTSTWINIPNVPSVIHCLYVPSTEQWFRVYTGWNTTQLMWGLFKETWHKDPYKTTSISMESIQPGFLIVVQLSFKERDAYCEHHRLGCHLHPSRFQFGRGRW